MVALRTGLSPHLLRAWERRYGVVTPQRSEGGQRLYSDADIERLTRLRRLVERGHAISRIASLPLEALAELEESAGEAAQETDGAGRLEDEARARSIREFNDRILRATLALDAAGLQEVLERAAVTLGVPDFLDAVAVTTLEDIGHGWAERSVTVAQEHMATAVFRRVLGWLLGVYRDESAAHRLVVATPPGERHELGALMVAITAALEGWSVTYLGADLPVEELLGAIGQTRAEAVGLSIVHPGDERRLANVVREIRAGLPPDVALLLGGAGARRIHARLDSPGVHLIDSLADLKPALQQLVPQQQA
ncbi:MAG TPA: MerR family transcriptional regulator [Gemmatimonadales bacterium]|nr:MerR family transcriptional regulator [Gemmatimonadales bacterium]